jgi:hypothetical protein
MPSDNTNVAYSTDWDIDKIIDYQDASTNPDLSFDLASGDDTIITVNHDYGRRHHVVPQYRSNAFPPWFEAGENGQFSLPHLVTLDAWSGPSDIKFRVGNGYGVTVSIEIRYWILSYVD